MSAVLAMLPDGRLHCQHGPIDLVIAADGPPGEVSRAFAAVRDAFPAILPELVGELAALRRPVGPARPALRGGIAQAMAAAVWPYRRAFVTPMAAVAGAVADHVLAVMCGAARLSRAAVNNGGDIALHLAAGETVTVGVVADISAPALDARLVLSSNDPVRGIATSGWRGRSQSLGIADAVTVLAATAAEADAAATMIANAVDVEDSGIARRPACEVKHDSDLGSLPVTVGVRALPPSKRAAALDAGARLAHHLVEERRIVSAYLALQGEARVAIDPQRLGADQIGCDKGLRVA